MTSTTFSRIRKQLGISQSKLSQLTGVSRFRLSQYENGYIELSTDEVKAIQANLSGLFEKLKTDAQGMEDQK